MLTLEFTTFWLEQLAVKLERIDFMAMNVGYDNRVVVHLDDPALSISL